MTVNYRALIAWFLLLVFVVFLVVRLDEKVTWNWFIVFIPLWLLDTLIIVHVVVFMVRHCTAGIDPRGWSILRKIFFLLCVGLKILVQILICLRVEYLTNMASYWIAIPLWVLLIVAIGDVSRSIWRRVSPCGSLPNCSCASGVCKSD